MGYRHYRAVITRYKFAIFVGRKPFLPDKFFEGHKAGKAGERPASSNYHSASTLQQFDRIELAGWRGGIAPSAVRRAINRELSSRGVRQDELGRSGRPIETSIDERLAGTLWNEPGQ